MRKLLTLWIVLAVALCCFRRASAQGWLPLVKSGGGGCTAATNFLARTSLTGSDVTNYTNLICGLVTDGVITGDLSGAAGCGTHLDVLYIFATANATEAVKNLCGTSFSATAVNAPTFTAYRGYTGQDSAPANVWLTTGYNPSTAGGNYTQNASHASAWSNTQAQAAVGGNVLGSGTTFCNNQVTELEPDNSVGKFAPGINENVGANIGATNATSVGWFLANRTGASASAGYKNGTLHSSPNTTSGALINLAMFVLAANCNGTADVGGGYQITMVSFGGDLVTSSLQTLFYNRLRTYMTAVGVP